MNSELSSAMRRRDELLARISVQRREMASIEGSVQASLKWMDRGLVVVRFLRDNPLLVAGVVAVLVVRRRSLAGIASAAWRIWSGYRNVAATALRLWP